MIQLYGIFLGKKSMNCNQAIQALTGIMNDNCLSISWVGHSWKKVTILYINKHTSAATQQFQK
jgi:hypothetical protein